MDEIFKIILHKSVHSFIRCCVTLFLWVKPMYFRNRYNGMFLEAICVEEGPYRVVFGWPIRVGRKSLLLLHIILLPAVIRTWILFRLRISLCYSSPQAADRLDLLYYELSESHLYNHSSIFAIFRLHLEFLLVLRLLAGIQTFVVRLIAPARSVTSRRLVQRLHWRNVHPRCSRIVKVKLHQIDLPPSHQKIGHLCPIIADVEVKQTVTKLSQTQ